MTEELQETNTPVIQPQPGDIISARRLAGLYFHYGLYLGNRMVINFQNPNKGGFEIGSNSADIILSSLDEFANGCDLFLENGLKGLTPLPVEETIERALSLFGKMKGDYSLFGNNCEHFAHWSKYGYDVSEQIESLESDFKNLGNDLLDKVGIAKDKIVNIFNNEETKDFNMGSLAQKAKGVFTRENSGTPFNLSDVAPISNNSRLATIFFIQQKLCANGCCWAKIQENNSVGVVFDMYCQPNPKSDLVFAGREFVPSVSRIYNLPDDIQYPREDYYIEYLNKKKV